MGAAISVFTQPSLALGQTAWRPLALPPWLDVPVLTLALPFSATGRPGLTRQVKAGRDPLVWLVPWAERAALGAAQLSLGVAT